MIISWNTELYIVSRKPGIDYKKSLELNEIKEFLETRRLSKSYDEYVKQNLLYFTEDLDDLANELNIKKIVPKGLYIMGIYGGEKKRGKKIYAGIALHEYRYDNIKFEFRLWNTRDRIIVPINLLKEYGIKVYKVIYMGEINPFRLRRFIDVILSDQGEASLKQFLQRALKINVDRIARSETIEMIKMLIEEVKQPNNIIKLDIDKHYIIYRCSRSFTAFAYRSQEPNVIIESHVAYAESEKEEIAYYYTAILNYLAYKVIQSGKAFIRSQFARPLFAVYMAGLAWKDIDDVTKNRVVELSKILHKKAPDKDYPNQKIALKDLERYSEFKELVKLLDSKVDRENLDKALDMVSGGGAEEE